MDQKYAKRIEKEYRNLRHCYIRIYSWLLGALPNDYAEDTYQRDNKICNAVLDKIKKLEKRNIRYIIGFYFLLVLLVTIVALNLGGVL